jgi:transposase InsO family protein
MGIRDKPIAPGSPWQNGFAGRLIGSIRRECVDHVVHLEEQKKAPLLAWAGLELRGFQQQRQRVSSVRPFYDTHKGRPGA